MQVKKIKCILKVSVFLDMTRSSQIRTYSKKTNKTHVWSLFMAHY